MALLQVGHTHAVLSIEAREVHARPTLEVLTPSGSVTGVGRDAPIELPWADSTFHRALCLDTVEGWRDPERALREIRRVLRPNGLLVLGARRAERRAGSGVGASPPRSRSDEEVLRLLAFAGFEVLGMEFDDSPEEASVLVVARR